MPLLERAPWAQALYAASLAVFLGWQILAATRARRTMTGPSEDHHTNELLIGAAVAGVAIGFGLASSTRMARIGGGEVAFAVGVVLIWTGLAGREWARAELGRFYRPVVAVDPDHQVIETGPYRYVRHPFYSGLLLGLVGLGLAQGSWLSVAVCCVLPGAAVVRRIQVEEAAMSRSLGARYDDYARGRARLVPFLW